MRLDEIVAGCRIGDVVWPDADKIFLELLLVNLPNAFRTASLSTTIHSLSGLFHVF